MRRAWFAWVPFVLHCHGRGTPSHENVVSQSRLSTSVVAAPAAGAGAAPVTGATLRTAPEAGATLNALGPADAVLGATPVLVGLASANAPEPAAGPDRDASARSDGSVEIQVPDDLPAFLVRGSRAHTPAVFLGGSCTTPATYVAALRRAAESHDGVLSLQGDVPCRDGTRRWSGDAAHTSSRIDSALRAAGVDEPAEITLVGYSQGAERAEWLANRFPARYRRFVLMAGPVVPSPMRLRGARAVVTLAGRGDVRETMASGARQLRRRTIPAVYFELPGGTTHGEISEAAGETLATAFDWLDEHARVP